MDITIVIVAIITAVAGIVIAIIKRKRPKKNRAIHRTYLRTPRSLISLDDEITEYERRKNNLRKE